MCVAFLKQMIRSPLDRRQSGLTLSNGKAIWNCEYWIRAWFSLKNNEPKFKRQKFFEKFKKYGNDLYRYSNTKQGNIDWMIKVFNYKTNALEKLTPISMVIKKFMRMRSLNVESLYWGNPHEDSYFIVR